LLIKPYQRFFNTVIFRFFFVYGPGQQNMLLRMLLQKVQQGEPIVIEGNPGLRINPIFIDDAIRVFEPALHLSKSELFNVAGNEIVTITDLVKQIEQVTHKKAVVQYKEAHSEGDLIGDNSHMKEVLGINPQINLLTGLSYMV
jgi:UDP-glucose 4-epimerase